MLRYLALLCVLIWSTQASKVVPKIVGGTEAAEGEFPYLASLRVYDYRNTLIHFCGSSIISHWLVMTAAHCMLDYPIDRIEEVVGTNDIWSGEDTPGGLNLIIAGFGYIDNYRTRPKRMQKLTVKSLTVKECQESKLKKEERWNPITDKLLCTYKDVRQGICQGDSGGALVHNGTVHGITSWNIPCGRGVPDVFTRVYKYLDWISTTIGKLPIPT
ncbi:unnamed protein product [Pieris macdunnoughi]|uniref:Peptidase S1 domain-containing protein n=1 Tax=Pieris macdunnoughi TaxID=345717 RepID=A0A821R861_9NEOP|nr:unnamed protein product [Pieris macdunnoughi]